MALPPGDAGTHGVATTEACSAGLVRALQEGEEQDIAKKLRSLQNYAEDLAKYCDPARNPAAFRRCQVAASCAAKPLIILACQTSAVPVRLAVFEALARMCFGNPEAAALVAASGQLDQAVLASLAPVEHVGQQQEHLAVLQLVQAVAAAVPEDAALTPLLPRVLALAAGGQEGFPPFRAVRIVATEVLTSLSYGRHRRGDVAALLTASEVEALIAGGADTGHAHCFTLSLLLANLCDLGAPPEGPGPRFGDLGRPLWDRVGFFDDLPACLTSALRGEPWPPETGGYHVPWKLVSTCLHLVLAGHAEDLRGCAAPLIVAVEARSATESPGVDAARAARLASVVLRGLLDDVDVVTKMREAPAEFVESLQAMASEEPAASDLLDAMAGGSESDVTRRGLVVVADTVTKPF